MGRFSFSVDHEAPQREMSDLSEAERLAVVRGEAFPRPRRAIVHPKGPSIVASRSGLSVQAVEVFDEAQRAGGTLDLRDVARRSSTHMDSVRRYVAELAHFGLAELSGRMTMTVAPRHAQTVLVANGWRAE